MDDDPRGDLGRVGIVGGVGRGSFGRGGRGSIGRGGRGSFGREVVVVLALGAIVVGVVLGAAVLTSLLPREGQQVVFHTPLAILVLIVGTAWLLWRISRREPPAKGG